MEVLRRVKEFFTKENIYDEEIKKNMREIRVSKLAIENFRTYVKGNNELSDEVLELKLKRNWILGTITLKHENGHYVRKIYGNLILHAGIDNGVATIKNVYNRKGRPRYYEVDEFKKARINKLYGL